MTSWRRSLLEVKNLTKIFKGKTVLDNVSLEVKEGEIFGYLGPNGAGKTTTVRLILGVLKPTSGEALVWGQRLGEHPELRKDIGVVLESDGLYERLSARENLDYFARLYGVADRNNKIESLLKFVGLYERRNDRLGNYSKGMRRKLALARAIVSSPKVLFLDEPASGLDPEAQHLVRDLILQLSREQGMVIFMNSHDLDEVERICTRIAIIQNGEVKAYDSVSSLRSRYSRPVMRFKFSGDEDVARAAQFLASQSYVTDVTSEDHSLSVTLSDENMSHGLLTALVRQDVNVEEARRLTRTLEEVYLGIMQEAKV
jgi:ABC-2 type transport system ATP-binding protein